MGLLFGVLRILVIGELWACYVGVLDGDVRKQARRSDHLVDRARRTAQRILNEGRLALRGGELRGGVARGCDNDGSRRP